ncbi:hypothetical protein [Mesorhizobium sp. GR13]|uniref:hypothetical protein n=1 Tax=Mesorhizobium sp. GR13 TaxID=2562308 RepID=UPI0010C006D4|nr:hypothetical protein [Mesorhizobium sp. GR13]
MALEGLKLVATPKKLTLDEVGKRRARLLSQIDKQVNFANQQKEGRTNRGRWWTIDDSGKPLLAIMYAKVPLELGKGKHAIACEDFDHVIEALKIAREAVQTGQFDDQLKAISEGVRRRFKKS